MGTPEWNRNVSNRLERALTAIPESGGGRAIRGALGTTRDACENRRPSARGCMEGGLMLHLGTFTVCPVAMLPDNAPTLRFGAGYRIEGR